MFFCVWLISLSIMFSRFINTVACVRSSFVFMAVGYLIVYHIKCIYHILLIHLFVNEHLDYFYLLTIVNNSAMNIGTESLI